MMFANISSPKRNVLEFDISDIDVSVINSLRRIILAEIPTIALAFDQLTDKNPDITIHVNNSALHNEYLGHRLSLLPLCFSEEETENFEADNYVFKLHVKNTTDAIKNVTTADFEIFDAQDHKYPVAFHKRIFPSNDITKEHILITKLRPNIYNKEKGEEINIEFKASKNIAKLHSRWCPVSCCSFFNIVDDKLAEQALQELYTKHDAKNDNDRKAIKRKFDSLDRFRYFKKNKYDEPCAFHFKIESECALGPQYLFDKAFDILIGKLDKLQDNMGTLDINKIHDNQNFYEITIVDEDFTLLNLLQALIYNMEIRETQSQVLEYIGYSQPHPLDNKMVLKIKMKSNIDIREFLSGCCKKIQATLREFQNQWRQK
jgi:DNA-directed RNA polymerase II subunit RPB3